MTDATKGKKLVWQSQPDVPMPPAFAKLAELDPMLKSIWEEANHPRYPRDPNFCRSQLWGATPLSSGKFGLKVLLAQRVGSGAAVEALRTEEAWDIAFTVIRKAIPPCNHAPGTYHKDGDVEWQDDTCTHQYPLEISKKVKDGKAFSTDRNADRGFKSLTAMLEESAGGEPAKNLVIKSFDDKNEPTFIVRDFANADALWNRFRFEQRLNAGEISQWYANHALYMISEDESKMVVEADLSPKDLAHYSWRPMVQCFKDEAFTAKLLKVGIPLRWFTALRCLISSTPCQLRIVRSRPWRSCGRYSPILTYCGPRHRRFGLRNMSLRNLRSSRTASNNAASIPRRQRTSLCAYFSVCLRTAPISCRIICSDK